MLQAIDITVRYGGVRALDRFTAAFPSGQVTAVVGPNGAGKTTLFDVVSGFVRDHTGSIRLNGKDLTRLTPRQRALEGLGRLFQDIRLFESMTVLENILVACRRSQGGQLSTRLKRGSHQLAERAMNQLHAWDLADTGHLAARELSFGQQKVVALLRILLADCNTILLDEPTSGLSAHYVKEVARRLRELAIDDKSVLLVEHNCEFVKRVADTVYVVVEGRVIEAGPPEQVLTKGEIQRGLWGL